MGLKIFSLQIWQSECDGLFKVNGTVNIFTHQMHSLVQIYYDEDLALWIGRDAQVTKVSVYKCDVNVGKRRQGFEFFYDLETRTKTYNFTNSDLCQGISEVEGPEKVSKFFVDYFAELHPIPVDTNPIDYGNATRLLTNVEHSSDQIYTAIFRFQKDIDITFKHFGDLDSDGEFHGTTILEVFSNDLTCFRGKCVENEINVIKGDFVHGVLQGLVSWTSHDEHEITYTMVKDGIIHSMVMTFGIKPLLGYPKGSSDYELDNSRLGSTINKGVGLLARFLNGRPEPKSKYWQGLFGVPASIQGWLYSSYADDSKNAAYIYPWGKLALVGEFKENIMTSAQKADIIKVKCHKNMLELEFSQPSGPKFYFSPGNTTSMGDMPLVPDPYEAMTVVVEDSRVPNSGHGLIA